MVCCRHVLPAASRRRRRRPRCFWPRAVGHDRCAHLHIREVLHRLFTGAGFSVQTAPDGHTALRAARRHPPDVVLTDLDMPGLTGLQLCQAIRADPTLSDIPVAILSGGLQPGDPRAADSQACGIWLKPFHNNDLVTAVRHLADLGHHLHNITPAHCPFHAG
ncbi:response regulator [Actinoplanes sp. NPDC020271]|uniref:response regulator n=1 Tax=Actinoplanes sp. NPDC020271 TaxID=3363896 RepID=UPI003792FA98